MTRCALLLCGLLTSFGAAAATPANRLVFARHCGSESSTASIVTDASLVHAVSIEGATNGLVTSAGGTVTVTGACHDDGALTIRVPSGMPVTIDAGGPGDLHLGDLQGPVTVQLRGDGALEAGRLSGGLVLEAFGSGDMDLGALSGGSTIDLYGSGDLNVGAIDVPSLALTQTSSGDVAIGGGRIGRLNATVSSSGDLSVAATVGGGQVVSTGEGDVSIARVLGALVQTQTGSGDVVVRARGPAAAAATIVQMPAMPGIVLAHGGISSSDHDHSTVVHLLMLLAIAAIVVVIVVRRRRRRRGVAGVSNDPRIAATTDRLEALARRVGRIETLVTSREFELNRSFREMGD